MDLEPSWTRSQRGGQPEPPNPTCPGGQRDACSSPGCRFSSLRLPSLRVTGRGSVAHLRGTKVVPQNCTEDGEMVAVHSFIVMGNFIF